MARSAPPQPQRPHQTPDQKRAAIRRLEGSITDLEAFDPTTLTQRDGNPQVIDIEAGIDAALTAAFGHGTPDDLRYRDAATLDHGPRTLSMSPSWISGRGGGFSQGPHPSEFQRYYKEGKEQALVLLRRAIKQLNDEIADQEAEAAVPATRSVTRTATISNRVFVVHGRAAGPKEAVARFLESLGLVPIILNEQPSCPSESAKRPSWTSVEGGEQNSMHSRLSDIDLRAAHLTDQRSLMAGRA